MVIEKCTGVFRGIFLVGRGRGLHGKIFTWRNLSCEKIISMKGVQDILALFKTKQNH